MMEFEEQKIISLLNATDMDPDAKAKELTSSMDRLVDYGINSCTQSTEYIELSNGDRVTDAEYINEFYKNAESAVITQLQAQVAEFAAQAKPEGLKLSCQACFKEYAVDLTFDYSNFFAKGF